MADNTWASFVLAWDDRVPVDVSFVFEHERPAGKHGFLTVDGDRFAFEDGTEGRFWGTNFNSGANFPDHDYSEMVARRLAKFGLNMMRTHQMDAEWSTPNIFEWNRAQPKDHTRTFAPESIERLDYLIHCLKQEGIYIYLDMLTYRQFRPGDGVDAVDELGQAAKPYTYFDPRLIALQKEFARDLWTHINPYTGLAYKDDPAIALTEIKNESDLFTHTPVLEPYRSRLEAMYRAWAGEHDLQVHQGDVDFAQPDQQIARFLTDVMRDFYADMIAYLREIGVRIPIAGTNWSRTLGVTAAQQSTDFNDSHAYWDYPWSDPPGTVRSTPMVGAKRNTFADIALMRVLDRPFFVSEWDQAYPHVWRAESPLAYAATAALQGWGGATIHTYRYSTWEPEDKLGGGGSTINGIVYRNFFDAFNDPAKFGLFQHAALLLRRGDVAKAKETVAIKIPDAMPDWLLKTAGDINALRQVERHRVGLSLPGEPTSADETVAPDDTSGLDSGEIVSDTGELGRDPGRRVGWIDTARTKAAYGFLGEAEPIELHGLRLDVETAFATIALSSLTDAPIVSSDSLLLTAVGRCQNSDAVFSEDGGRWLEAGRAPTLIEPIQARIDLETERPNLKVWLISDKGEAVKPLATTYEDGVLSFNIGPQPAWTVSTIYYLIRI